jgi:ribosomal protein S27E
MPLPPRIPFKTLAERHIADAKRLLGGNDREQTYACLELRFALEALTYDILQSYGDDRGTGVDNAMAEWHPSAIFEHLLKHDPNADRSIRMVMTMRPQYRDGSVGETTRYEVIEERLDVKWAAKAYRALSSFLHQPTIAHAKKAKTTDRQTLHRKAEEVIARLEQVLASPVSNSRLEFRLGGYECPSCGHELSVAAMPFLGAQAKTTCLGCGKLWNVEPGGDGETPRFVAPS